MIIETKHEIYGRVLVNEDDLYNTKPFVEVRLLNERPNLPSRITVGKVALEEKGSYIPKKRGVSERAQQYLPLVGKAVKMLRRAQDDWDELYCVGCVGLVEADAKFDHNSNYAFASYAKPYIMGHIKNFINPERNGEMNLVQVALSDNGMAMASNYGQQSDVMRAFYRALDDMTDKQRRVMKMLYVEGHTQEGVARALNITQPAVNHIQERAIKKVKAHFL